MKRLAHDFFERSTLQVAPELLGKFFVRQLDTGQHIRARIIEVEAYTAADDPASHAFRGPTPRSKIMYGPAGFLYVYFIYGKYFCANIVCERDGVAGAVLLRGVEITGVPIKRTNGPGKLCQALHISTQQNGADLVNGLQVWVEDGPAPTEINVTPRIGIKVAQDKLWRFVEKKPSP